MRLISTITASILAAASLTVCGIAYLPRLFSDRLEPAESLDGRCQAITRQGTRCRRAAAPDSAYCSQHSG